MMVISWEAGRGSEGGEKIKKITNGIAQRGKHCLVLSILRKPRENCQVTRDSRVRGSGVKNLPLVKGYN